MIRFSNESIESFKGQVKEDVYILFFLFVVILLKFDCDLSRLLGLLSMKTILSSSNLSFLLKSNFLLLKFFTCELIIIFSKNIR